MRLLDIYSPNTCGDVTMWGTAALGETKKRTLDQADISGFESIYGGSGGGTTLTAPVLLSPANGASGVATTPTLAWSPASGATSYDVYLGTTASPAFGATVTGTSVQVGPLAAGTYYWRVVAKSAAATASSDTFVFTVGSPAPTTGPTLISPADGTTGVSAAPVMQWSAVSGALAYDIYIGTTASRQSRIGSVNATSVSVTGFRAGTVYYWRIVARTAAGSFSSSVGSFQTN
jgi:hypothetical protein